MSNVDQDGEWKFRKITLMGVVRSFVSQLRPGQDLTRVSLPAVLLYPYSLLEVIGYRELTFFEVLLQLNKEEDPLQRTLIVIKWLLCTIQQETFHKKPYNPLLGETHECHIESSVYGRSDFISEQVSHHPPISAFIATNSQENVNLSGNISFNVKFGGNLVNVVTEGAAMVTAEERMEQYELSKSLPDMTIKNVIWGTKRIFWSGEMTINCPKTGYSVNLLFKESGSDNVVKGTISNIFTPERGDLYSIDGKLGGVINYIDLKKNEKKLLIDVEAVKKPKISYQGKDKLDPLASLAVWADVSKYIIENDMEKADECKKKIEQDQRVRVAERKANGLEQASKYFQGTEFGWVFKDLSAKTKNTLTYSEDVSDDSDKDPFDDDDDEEEEIEEEKKIVIPPQKREKPRSPEREAEKPPTPRTLEESKSRTPASTPASVDRHEIHEDEARSPKAEHPRLHLQVAKSSSSSLPQSIHSPKSNPINLSASYGDLERKKDSDSHDEDEKRFKGWTNPVKKARNAFKRESTQEKELIKQEKKRLREETRKSLSSKHGNDGEETAVMQGWMKMRNSMKIWVNRFFVLKGGKLIYYSDEREVAKERCAGILRLAHCEIRQRANKDSYAFKIAHTLHYPIYHKYGLRGETLKLAMLPVSWNFCILRAPNDKERKQWISAIHEQIAYANEHDSDPPPMAKEFHAMNAMNGIDDDDDVFSEGEEEKIFSSPEPERADKALNYDRATKEEEAQLSGSPPNIVVESPSSAKKRSKKSSRAKTIEVNPDLGPEEAFFAKHESLHRTLMEGMTSEQKKIIKQLQQQTVQTMEQWKRETDMKLATMEKRLTTSISAKDKTAKALSLSYLQLVIVVIVCLLIGRLLQLPAWNSYV